MSSCKKPSKEERDKLLLFGLVELYLKKGTPIGSQTLQEHGFDSLSPATIRNYFVKLEEQGYLKQQHSSGGRIPTPLAYRLYASHNIDNGQISEKEREALHSALNTQTREVARFLQQASDKISDMSHLAIFISSPRFDNDIILEVKLLMLDQNRILCVLISDFGLIRTETLYTEKKIGHVTLKKIETFFHWKLTQIDKPHLTEEELQAATRLYNEAMLRHIVHSTHFTTEEIYKTGFSKLLHMTDFNDASALASGLSLFENSTLLRSLLRECVKLNHLHCWIGEDLNTTALASCSIIAIPYYIHHSPAGAIGIIGPNRIPYRKIFGLLKAASEEITASLTNSLYKFKITYRRPQEPSYEEIKQTNYLLLENKSYDTATRATRATSVSRRSAEAKDNKDRRRAQGAKREKPTPSSGNGKPTQTANEGKDRDESLCD